MADRTPTDGKPYYCAYCGLGLGELMACENVPFCRLETEEEAKKCQRPVRVQLSRRKGFRLAEAAGNDLPTVNVARPSKWGNPFTKQAAIESEYANASNAQAFVVECFRDWIGPSQSGRDWWQGRESDQRRRVFIEEIAELRGKNLACWCSLTDHHGKYSPCHADVLLELANRNIDAPEVCNVWARHRSNRNLRYYDDA